MPIASPPGGLHVALVSPEIPWNTGNAGRSCLAFGAALHLIRPLGFALTDREVRRAGLDYWEQLAPRVWPDWAAFEAALPALGTPWLFAAAAGRPLWEVGFLPAAVLVFGRESVGLPEDLRRRFVDRLVHVPMAAPGVRSLNLSSCVAVALAEVERQRRSAAGRDAGRP